VFGGDSAHRPQLVDHIMREAFFCANSVARLLVDAAGGRHFWRDICCLGILEGTKDMRLG